MSRTILGGNSPDRAVGHVRATTEYSRSDLSRMPLDELDRIISYHAISVPGSQPTKGARVTAILNYFSDGGSRI